MKRGHPARVDYEYERNGTANIFMLFAPLEGGRQVEVTDRHAAVDYAAILRDPSDRHFPGASKIVLVQDNLSTHTAALLYAAFAPAEGRRIAERFEWHYMQKHGSWLDMAESERGPLIAMSGPTYPGQGHPHPRNRGLAEPMEQAQHNRQLAIHEEGSTEQTRASVPVTLVPYHLTLDTFRTEIPLCHLRNENTLGQPT
jgi:hypothetical protein